MAVAEKGKAYGSHLLSGACVRPQPLLDLFPDANPDDIPHYGEVTGLFECLSRQARGRPYAGYLCLTDEIDEAVAFIENHPPQPG